MIVRCETIGAQAPVRGADGDASPLYVICSPSRRVGKTLLARLLAEHYIADARPVLVFDLADEEPRLADFLTDRVRIAKIGDLRGQMRLFDALIESNTVPKVIDVSDREFAKFFEVAETIGLFQEVRRRSVEPLILFPIDPSPRAEKAYGQLRQRFVGTSLIPVRNLLVAKGLPYGASFPHASTLAVSLEIPVLGPAAKALIDRERFSFAKLSSAPRPPNLSMRSGDELRAWWRRIRLQFREIQLCLMRKQILTALQRKPRSTEPSLKFDAASF